MSFCMKCGTELIKGKCPNCDIITAYEQHPQSEKTVHPNYNKKGKPKRKRKTIIITVCLVVGVIIASSTIALALFFRWDADYNDAIALLKNGEPKQAAALFEDLGSFKESENYLKECSDMVEYDAAVEILLSKDYANALEAFAELENYKDSDELEELCQNHVNYKVAIGYIETEEYPQAKGLLEDMLEFNNSKDMVLSCEFGLKFEEAMDKMDGGGFAEAVQVLVELEYEIEESRLEFDETIPKEKIKYYLGMCHSEEQLYYSAYLAFKAAGKYLDASQLSKSCIQPLLSQEFYKNPLYSKDNVELTYYAPTKGTLSYNYSICIKIFEQGGDLVSVSLVAFEDELTIYLPAGIYYYEACHGDYWFGSKEFFGALEFHLVDEVFTLNTDETYTMKF